MARNNNQDIDINEIDENDPDAFGQLRDYAKRQAQKARNAENLEREVSILRAGIDTTSPLGKAFVATFEGDFTDKDAIIAAAKELHPDLVKGTSSTAATDTASTGETTTATAETPGATTMTSEPPTGTAERTALANGAVASGAAVEDVRGGAMRTAREAIDAGASQEEAAGSLIANLARGAAEGKVPVLDHRGQTVLLGQ
jgi:hypothetical protein